MLRYATVVIVLAVTSAALAAEPKSHRDIAYTDPADYSRRLNVYAPADGEGHPVMVWLHGGGWRRGDKANLQHKP